MKKNLTSVIIFVLSGIILALGVWQLILYIPLQLEMLDNAVLQGATSEQTSDYYWHDFIPQVLTYVITIVGFTAVLLTAGMLHLRLAANQPSDPSRNMAWPFQPKASADDELDDLFDGFEVVDTEHGK
ncbi:hypothetical protein M3201_03200 [Paenibacillus motobuensis]|uniref:hypothetical protein n=1 Tax=Paenibacillus TaxID=44249 RepID=UPI00203B8C31|nr:MULTISPECIES: hypothetical protein [Paenibacillus]MCM3038710.1 hypothetical protein [Paenibacillus lutimineralis]MCM3645814.1 hypothetical protein [Paenibacillus motobuensis]